MRWLALVLAPIVTLGAGCLRPSPREVMAMNCASSIHSFESRYCGDILPTADRDQLIAAEAQHLGFSCQDPTSQARLRELDTTCIAKFRVATSDRDREDEQLRARYAVQVSALKKDGAYVAARDAYRSARDEAGIAAHEYEERGYPIHSPFERKAARTRQDADTALGRLHAVITRHGIEPKYGTVLGLW